MTRPLIQHGVGQLEDLFAKSKMDAKVLRQLEHELGFRQVPRAVALLSEVQAAMGNLLASTKALDTAAIQPAATPESVTVQPSLWERPTSKVHASAIEPPKPLFAEFTVAVPPMALVEAYKFLRATPGTTWESIEQTRRQLVQQSHPARVQGLSSDKRAQILAEAKRVNVAYLTLSQARCDGR